LLFDQSFFVFLFDYIKLLGCTSLLSSRYYLRPRRLSFNDFLNNFFAFPLLSLLAHLFNDRINDRELALGRQRYEFVHESAGAAASALAESKRLRYALRHEEVEVVSRVAQVGHLYLPAHLCLVVLVQYVEHLLGIRCHLDRVEKDILFCELLYLPLYQAALGVALRMGVMAAVVVLITVARRVSDKNGVATLGLPILLESVLKTASNVLWQVSTAHCVQILQKLLTGLNVIAEAKDFRDLVTIAVISIGNDRYANLNVEVLIANAVDNSSNFLLTGVYPRTH